MFRSSLFRAVACTSLAGVSASASVMGVLAAQKGGARRDARPLAGKAAPKTSAPRSKSTGAAKGARKSAGQRSGQQIFLQSCAPCHGANGEGGKGYSAPLTGDQSVLELARFIALEMPPDPAPKLAPSEASRVASYIHGAFYSPVAQARNRPARVELSRLTVRQLRNSLSDLIGTFRKEVAVGSARGLSGKYFKTRQRDKPIVERVDGTVDFSYGVVGALAEQDDPYQFMMEWNGSVMAPDTGEYEFVVRSEQAVELWVNDLQAPLIDAQVKSGDGMEYRAAIWLQAGRWYPLKLNFFKGVVGVDNLKKLKEKPPQRSSIQLGWKRPHRTDEVIPQDFLLPETAPRLFVAQTPFAPDDRSIGYERGTSVSKEWSDAATSAALEVAGYVTANLRELSGVPDDAADRDAKLKGFARRFVERAFRRPLSDEQAQFFVERQFAAAPNAEAALKRVILLALKSPRFLYREVIVSKNGGEAAAAAPKPAATNSAAKVETVALKKGGANKPPGGLQVLAGDAYDVASRLSYALWDSMPDAALLEAARKGELSTREQVREQAARLMEDPRARTKARDFYLQWLKVDAYPDLAKDLEKYPGFDAKVVSDLRTSLEMALDAVVWSEKSDFRDLLLSDKVFLNGRLAQIYNVPLKPDAPFQAVVMDYGRRTGVLTHPYLLSSFAYIDTSSPIHRGVLIARSLLGRRLMPPPQAFTPIEAKLHPRLTTRQRVALQTRPSACSSCHNLINPLGFSLEKFDAIGRLRAKENDVPVDASGFYRLKSGQTVKFSSSRDLSQFLAGSEEVHAAFTEKLFHHIVKQPVAAYGPETAATLVREFRAGDFNMRRQMIEVAVMTSIP
jgi:mono/diheme cytochrome c family protein